MLLYKYLPPERIDVLKNLKIRFTPIFSPALNDPFECSFLLNPAEKDRRAAQQDDFYAEWLQVKVFLERNFSRIGVLCLSKVPDNLLMWAHYSRSHTGLVVGLEADHEFFRQMVKFRPLRPLEHVLEVPGFGTLREVKYSQERFAANLGDAVEEAFFLKSLDWSYEQEVRILRNIDKEIHLFPFPPDLVRRVIVGANADKKLRSEIAEIATGSSLQHVELLEGAARKKKVRLEVRIDGPPFDGARLTLGCS